MIGGLTQDFVFFVSATFFSASAVTRRDLADRQRQAPCGVLCGCVDHAEKQVMTVACRGVQKVSVHDRLHLYRPPIG